MLAQTTEDRSGEHGTLVPDQQVKLAPATAYPIDKYLRMDHTRGEIANILGEEDWTSEPVMKPEDEIMLKKLHDMLQSTAEELRDLSSEILRSRQPAVQVKTKPTPLDEEYNEKVRVKEMVEAKFNDRILVEKKNLSAKQQLKKFQPQKDHLPKQKVNTGVQVDISLNSTRKIANECSEKVQQTIPTDDTLNVQAIQEKSPRQPPRVLLAYDQHKTVEVKNKEILCSQKYIIQEMPSIQIRSQLTEQKVVNLHILPSDTTNKPLIKSSNSAVFEINRETTPPSNTVQRRGVEPESAVTRKIARIPSCETSEPTIKSHSESESIPTRNNKLIKPKQAKAFSVKPQRRIISMHKGKDNVNSKYNRESTTSHHVSEKWKKKLNVIYGKPSSSKPPRTKLHSSSQISQKKAQNNYKPKPNEYVKQTNIFKTAEYVPYSKLTLGGVSVSDIENEIANVSNRADLPLSPILDKILSSHDNSLQDSPRKNGNLKETLPFSKSDENLLKEVLDIDQKIKKTLNKNFATRSKTAHTEDRKPRLKPDKDSDEESYDDDFDEEPEKSDQSKEVNSRSKSSSSNYIASASERNAVLINAGKNVLSDGYSSDSFDKKNAAINNKTFNKTSNLSFKDAIEIFEFVHSVDTQDNATQSNKTQKISLKETQTSPRNDGNIQPVNNVPQNQESLDNNREISKMFTLEKDFIKNLIVEEYGDLFEIKKNIAKPSTSKIENTNTVTIEKNIASHPRDTQTSPLRVKNVMTSPSTTITRTRSTKRLTIQRQPSPLVLSNHDNSTPGTHESDLDEAGITVNLSSPRFNLRLPQTSRDVISNLESTVKSSKLSNSKTKLFHNHNKDTQTSIGRKLSSSESWNDETESDVSSLGEVNWRLQMGRAGRARPRLARASESSSASMATSSLEACSEIFLPAKSEGEVSVGQL